MDLYCPLGTQYARRSQSPGSLKKQKPEPFYQIEINVPQNRTFYLPFFNVRFIETDTKGVLERPSRL